MLKETERKILSSVVQPKTAQEIAWHCGLSQETVYKPLRLLQRLGLVEKEQKIPNAPAIFFWTGKAETSEIKKVIKESRGYIRYHDPFNQCVKSGGK